MPKHGKKYREAAQKVEPEKLYSPEEAISLLRESPSRSSTRPSKCTRGSVSILARPIRRCARQ